MLLLLLLDSTLKTLRILLRRLKPLDHVKDDSYLVLSDICSVYTNIPHEEGMKNFKRKLRKSKPYISIKVILTFLKLILTLYNVVFNSINYVQKKCCAMGTKCAPSCADIFIGWFEEKFIFLLPTDF